jgi:hypothetical protein
MKIVGLAGQGLVWTDTDPDYAVLEKWQIYDTARVRVAGRSEMPATPRGAMGGWPIFGLMPA